MAEPDNIVLEHLRAMRAEMTAMRADITDIKRRLESKAEAAQVADLDSKLTGLTHVVVSSLGSVVQSLDTLNKRVAKIERERV
jgi:hypothetical protein